MKPVLFLDASEFQLCRFRRFTAIPFVIADNDPIGIKPAGFHLGVIITIYPMAFLQQQRIIR
jgi:hypothetical protein